eukprot:CAMPEP_0177687886 /NCGR_PEP_ID=MMETSP0447-20121125/34372_1 /TAXON_ID=0 /ORGANISM="Stygamoeba regulata, Strain BSH-02190019" /LENGTH=976 /DNA_ID=CAMNT_0019198167 /DNA_START=18 /DNA_END=2948 /DNA_ORIENTATION=+
MPNWSVEEREKVLVILEKFHVVSKIPSTVELGGSQSSETPVYAPTQTTSHPFKYLVPSRLPEEEPYDSRLRSAAIMKKLAGQVNYEGVKASRLHAIYERSIRFRFLPHAFFPRVIVRSLHLSSEVKIVKLWRSGMVVTQGRESIRLVYDSAEFVLRIQCRVFRKPSENKLLTGLEQAGKERPIESSLPSLFISLVRMLDETIEAYYRRQRVERFASCSHCLFLDDEKPHQFSVEDCGQMAADGGMHLHCERDPTAVVQLHSICPELGFVGLVQIDPDTLEIMEKLGQGGFGTVYKGRIDGTKICAVKRLNQEQASAELFREFQQEATMMSKLNHPNLVNLFGITTSPLQMLMELAPGGDLGDLLHNDWGSDIRDISWKFRYKLAYDIASGMNFLHSISPPIVHRDLRSPNVFLVCKTFDETTPLDLNVVHCKVADFGLACQVLGSTAGLLATWQWLAPETIDPQVQEYDHLSDVYSFGIVLWELCTGQLPFDEFDEFADRHVLSNGEISSVFRLQEIKHAIVHKDLRPTFPAWCPAPFADLARRCWKRAPEDRPSFRQCQHELLRLLDPSVPPWHEAMLRGARSATDPSSSSTASPAASSRSSTALTSGALTASTLPACSVPALSHLCSSSDGTRWYAIDGDHCTLLAWEPFHQPDPSIACVFDFEPSCVALVNDAQLWIGANRALEIWKLEKSGPPVRLHHIPIHSAAICGIVHSDSTYHPRGLVWTVDEAGKSMIWLPESEKSSTSVEPGEQSWRVAHVGMLPRQLRGTIYSTCTASDAIWQRLQSLLVLRSCETGMLLDCVEGVPQPCEHADDALFEIVSSAAGVCMVSDMHLQVYGIGEDGKHIEKRVDFALLSPGDSEELKMISLSAWDASEAGMSSRQLGARLLASVVVLLSNGDLLLIDLVSTKQVKFEARQRSRVPLYAACTALSSCGATRVRSDGHILLFTDDRRIRKRDVTVLFGGGEAQTPYPIV